MRHMGHGIHPASDPLEMIRFPAQTTARATLRFGVAALCTAFAAPATPTPIVAQDVPEAISADSVLGELKRAQIEFEQYRESNTPILRGGPVGGTCDARIGQTCVWFGGEDEADFPAELREVSEARRELIRLLQDGFEQAPHRWILGQLVHYVVENGDESEAARLARTCGVDERWWCDALLGYALHIATEYVEAEAAFRTSLAAMPDDERRRWLTPRYIVTGDVVEEFEDAADEELLARFELYWTLSDPLFIFEGNDRLTDHFARWVVALNRRDAWDPIGSEWRADLEETLIRYGRNTGYGRTHDPTGIAGRAGGNGGFGRGSFGRSPINDTRRMIGFHHPKSRGYLFPEEFLESPSDIPPESWITAPREARTWHAPLYAPEVRGLETQVGRFRREYQMLVVGAYRPTVPAPSTELGVVPAWGPEGGLAGAPAAGLFLIPEDGRDPLSVRGRDEEGVMTIRVRPGRYVAGLEVVDFAGRQAWRARQGMVQEPLLEGMVDVSDLMILESGAPLPETLDEALEHIRPGIRLRAGERFPVIWEMYGLRLQEPVRVTLGFSRGRPEYLGDPQDFIDELEAAETIDVTFEDRGPDVVQTVFRSVELQLPDLDPGEYTLHLRLDLAGRTPLVTSRPIIVH